MSAAVEVVVVTVVVDGKSVTYTFREHAKLAALFAEPGTLGHVVRDAARRGARRDP